jgi:hypothetical protein
MAAKGRPRKKADRDPEALRAERGEYRVKRLRPKPYKAWTPDVEQEVLWRISSGQSMTQVCADPDMPSREEVWERIVSFPQTFGMGYRRACEARAVFLADELLAIADAKYNTAEEVLSARLRVDSRKWITAKLYPRVFGDRVRADVQMLDAEGNPANPANVTVVQLGMEKLDSRELRVLVGLYRKMGVRLPHEPGAEPGPVIEHDPPAPQAKDDDDGTDKDE